MARSHSKPITRRIIQITRWLVPLLLAAVSAKAAETQEQRDFFETRIRPVLVAQCYECHSAAAARLQGGLRLDWREGLRRGGDSGPAVVPGNVEDSLILSALRHESFQMPPGKRLSPRIVADFEQWVRDGAVDPRDEPSGPRADDEIRLAARHHWAFRPLRPSGPPQVHRADLLKTPVDAFVLARLEQAGLELAPQAEPAVLARRVYFDLTGLPPTPEQLQQFLADPAPDAYERLVDRLLASPRYGERWGRYWLDVARYADNKGYVFFEEQTYPWAWTYRDYVVQAFNQDLPFDRFVLEQLAADQLPAAEASGGEASRPGRSSAPSRAADRSRLADRSRVADPSRLAALGFVTVGARFMNNTHDILDDRIDVVTRGLLGLTVACARCHDHKYDPLSQADYYGLYGVFRSSVEPILPPELHPPAESEAYRKFQEGMSERLRNLDAFIEQQRTEIMRGARQRAGEYLLAVWNKRNHPETENFMLLTDKGALNPALIHRWETYLNRAKRDQDPIWTLWHACAELPEEGFAEAVAGWHARWLAGELSLPTHPLVREAFRGQPPASMQEVAEGYGRLLADVDRQWQDALAASSGESGESGESGNRGASEDGDDSRGGDASGDGDDSGTPDDTGSRGEQRVTRLASDEAESLRQVLYGPGSPPMIPRELSWGFLDLLPDRPTQAEFKKLLKEVETWSSQQPGAPPRAMALFDAQVPYDPAVFVRGNPNRQGPSVERRFPEFFAPGLRSARARDGAPAADRRPDEGSGRLESPAGPVEAGSGPVEAGSGPVEAGSGRFETGSGRLELAQRIVDPAQPLTPRVLANRVWMHHFGRPLVDTPSDFGLRSEPPTHPELLDWLAAELLRRGWSVKHLHRTLLLSATYRQSSQARREVYERAQRLDPANRLLWSFPRQRLDFEAMRDSLLAVTGRLDARLGGPPVQTLSGFTPRRTLYGFVDRMNLPGLMRTFDYPDPAATSPQREHTTVAPQALFFLNHDFVFQCAQHVVRRPDVAAASDPETRVRRIYQLLLSRPPDTAELRLARRYLELSETESESAAGSAAAAWQYGYAAVDETHEVRGFRRLEHWTGSRWQAGPQLPDPKLGWVFLDRLGGHPAATLERCAVRRWTAPRDGRVQVDGRLNHEPQPGNGVRGRLIARGQELLGNWTAHHLQVPMDPVLVDVRAGDTLDFVVDFQGDILHDEHHWPVTIRYQSASERSESGAANPAAVADWDSQRDFVGAATPPWVQYVHALLMSNEFLFID